MRGQAGEVDEDGLRGRLQHGPQSGAALRRQPLRLEAGLTEGREAREAFLAIPVDQDQACGFHPGFVLTYGERASAADRPFWFKLEGMSFLDNLENNLKSLESREEGADAESAKQRDARRQKALAAAPWAERLKSDPYTAELLKQATRAGYQARTKVHLAWLGTTLRLEARERRLELRPTPEGVVAAFLENGQEIRTQPVDLKGDPATLVREWLNV